MVKAIFSPVFFLLVILCMAVMLPFSAQAAMQVNMPEGVTPISHQVFDLHMFAIWVCVGIGVVVYSVMIYSIIRHRKSKGVQPAHFHGNTFLEIVWTIIPFILLIVLAIPATRVLGEMEDTNEADITIKITGYQWKWQYEYLDQGIRFFSNLLTPVGQIYGEEPKNEWYLLEVDKPLVLPIHHKIRFLVTANDVIHSWWVPELGVKRDAMPGFIHESWATIEKPGIYRGQCAELCGVNHAFMPIVVRAVTDAEFKQWVAKESAAENSPSEALPVSEAVTTTDTEEKPSNATFAALMKEGEEQYNKYCSVCHKVDGLGMPPVFPAMKGSSVAVGGSIERHIQLILTGVPGTAMQAFAEQLTDQELAAIVTYERNAWDNNTGDIVQAVDVAAVRRGSQSQQVSVKNQVKSVNSDEVNHE